METKTEPSKYRVLAETFKDVGKDALIVAGLAASVVTPFVPSDVQEKLAKRVGAKNEEYAASCMTAISGMAEIAEVTVALAYFAPGLLPLGAAGFYLAIDGSMRAVLNMRDNVPTASLAIEIPYQIGKAAYGYLEDTYREAKRKIIEGGG